jgi:hypothetical protein
MLHSLLKNGVMVIFKEPFLGWSSNLSGALALHSLKVAIDVLAEISGTPLEHPSYSPNLAHAISGLFQPRKRELQGQNRLELAANSLEHVFEMWLECCKKYITCQGRYFKKETVTAPPHTSDSE